MKKLNKIIPLACIATTLPSVAPLLASCSQETKYIFDLTDTGYDRKPTRVQWDGSTELDSQSATELYYNMVKEDPKQFIYDYMYGRNKFIHSIARQNGAWIKNFTLSSTLPKIGTTTASFSHEPDMTYPTASFTIEGHLDIVLSLDSRNATENKMDLVVDSKVTYKDCIFYAYADEGRGEANSWTVGMMDLAANATDGSGTCIAYLYNNNPWSIDVDYNCDATTSYYDPETGTHTTSTQNYNFKRKLDDYFSLNDVLSLTYDYRGRDLESFPIGFLWYLIPMDFASIAFTSGGGDDPISKKIAVNFTKGNDWVFAPVPDYDPDNPAFVASLPGALYITGLPDTITQNDIKIVPYYGENGIVYKNTAIKQLAKATIDGGNNDELQIDVQSQNSNSNEYWDLTIQWNLGKNKYDTLDAYFKEGEGKYKTVIAYTLMSGYITVYVGGTGPEHIHEVQSDSFWKPTINLDFTKMWGK